MTRLGTIVGIESGVKGDAERAVTQLYHQIQRTAKDGPLHGLSRTFTPFDDQAVVQQPPQSTLVQLRVADVMDELARTLTRLFDVEATKDRANCDALADVKVDGTVLLAGVPVTTLIFLEKRLRDVKTFIGKLPTLDPADTWIYSEEAGCYVTPPVETIRYRSEPQSFVLVPATDKHPAQAQRIDRDVPEGKWHTVKFCGAVPADRVKVLLARTQVLLEAVQTARQEANTRVVDDVRIGGKVFEYLFAA